MPTQEEVNRINEELKRHSDDTGNIWYKGACLDTATSAITPENRKLTANRPDETSVADLWNSWNPDTTYKKFNGDASEVTHEDIEELSRRDPAFKVRLDNAKMEEITLEFTRGNRAYVSNASNFNKMLRQMGKKYLDVPNLDNMSDGIEQLYKAGHWNVADLNETFRVLTKAGQLEVEYGTYKELTKAEKLSVIADVRACDFVGALGKYLKYSFDGCEPSTTDGRSFSAEHSELVTKAVWFVWSEARAGALTSSELTEFKKHMGKHQIITIKLLEDAYPHWQAAASTRQSISEPEVVQSEPELTREQLEKLTPEELDARIREEQRAYLRGR
jgi:hypothetical protein